MRLARADLSALVTGLRSSPGLQGKREIGHLTAGLNGLAGTVLNGDDAAALPDPDGYTLIAAEGMHPAFVEAEPWFAGFCAVMTNVSDIAAMGGRARAIVDVLWAGRDPASTREIIAGLAAGAQTFGVPLVGGHTGRSAGAACLSAAVLGKARRLITSFDARPGDVVMACIDLRGEFRAESCHFDAVSRAAPTAVRAQLEILPQLAEADVVTAGKDISMAGLVGTLLMLLETSGCGAVLDLAAVPAPASADEQPQRWLEAFPSFGFLLAVRPERVRAVAARFDACGVSASPVAWLHAGSALDVEYAGERVRYWDLAEEPLMGFPKDALPTAIGAPSHA